MRYDIFSCNAALSFTFFNSFADYSFSFSTCQAKQLNQANFLECAQKFWGDIVFYNKFASLCQEKGVSVSRGALEAGISKSLVSKWKTNQTEIPSSEVLTKLSNYFHIPISELLEESKLSTPNTDPPCFNRADLKYALFHGHETVTDAMLDEVLSFAEYIAHREEAKNR